MDKFLLVRILKTEAQEEGIFDTKGEALEAYVDAIKAEGEPADVHDWSDNDQGWGDVFEWAVEHWQFDGDEFDSDAPFVDGDFIDTVIQSPYFWI